MLHVHHADHAETLVAGLAHVLREPLADPFAIERVGVHSRGLERWLAQRLSHHLGAVDGDGICAAIDFPFPGRLLADVLSAASDVPPEDDPWRAERLVWPLLDLLEDRPDLAVGTPLAAHLTSRGQGAADGRLAAVRAVADLFDRYAVHRPEMLLGWSADRGTALYTDGHQVPARSAWQPRLWRALRDRLEIPSPAERLETARARLLEDPARCDLPERLSLFGLTALPASYLVVLRALAAHRAVHLFLLHPSPALWDRGARILAERRLTTLPDRDDDPLREVARNPLLRAWGRDAREMQVVLRVSGPDAPDDPTAWLTDPGTRLWPTGSSASPAERSLLARLQADVRGDVAPPGAPGPGQLEQRPELAADDRSLQLHSCHGPARQVEVLRDVLLDHFATDPSLEPRDVLVLCPDIERFAPLVDAVFTTGGPDAQPSDRLQPGALRVRIADRAVTGSNPLLRAVAEVLRLASSRVTASEVRDLANHPLVRARFGFDEGDLARIDAWVAGAGIRWGLDTAHRAAFGLDTAANTWHAGMQRLLVGVAMADEDQRTVGDVLPYDDVTGDDVDLVGRFAEFVVRVEGMLPDLMAPRTLRAWCAAVGSAADALTDTSVDPWQRIQLVGLLDELVTAAGDHAETLELSLAEFREHLTVRLERAEGRVGHRTGDLTVCTLVPMRSVPHRVVCLLGMDDGAFPRRGGPDGDDLLDQVPRVGDRDPRTEDRQLLLDALLAADERLVILYSGRDERTNEARPPAVPIGELLDVVDRTVRARPDTAAPDPATETPGGPAPQPPAASRQLTVEHPLHPFDPRNFSPGALGLPDRALGTDAGDLAGAHAWVGHDRDVCPTLIPDPLLGTDAALFPPLDRDVIELADLINAVSAPLPTLFAERLGLRFPGRPRSSDDELAVELDKLSMWAVGQRCLDDRREGRDPARTAQIERARGSLPPGRLADPTLAEVTSTVDAILALGDELGVTGAPGLPLEVEVELSDGRRLIGTIDDVREAAGGQALIGSSTFSRLKEKHRLRAWVNLLVAVAMHPDRAWQAVTLGRGRQGETGVTASASVLGPLTPDRARRELERLVELHDLALTRPLPILTETSAAYAETEVARRSGGRRSPLKRADARWRSGIFPGEDADPAHVHVFGPDRDLEDLLAVPADATEEGDDWDLEEPSRLGRWALRLWAPLLEHERIEDR